MSGGKVKKGGIWENCVFFDTESSGSGRIHRIADSDLIERMEELVGEDLSERITMVKTCTKPLNESQWTNLILYHEFVILKTDSFYWSIEKGGEGIHIQRSYSQDNVRLKFNREKRLQGTYWEVTNYRDPVCPARKTTVHDVLMWLWKRDELKQCYNYLENNCKHLSRRVYEYVKA